MPDSPIPTCRAVLERGITEGLHTGAQLYVSRAGEVIADLGIGENRPGVPMDADTVHLWLSAGKPFTAVAIAQLWEQGKLDLDDPVTRFIPEFGQHGKEGITLRHILTHTSGFRVGEYPLKPAAEIIARLCALPIEKEVVPGKRAAYHPASSWYILGEIIQRVDGREFADYIHEEIVEPLAMKDVFAAMPPAVYHALGSRLGCLLMRDGQRSPAPDPRESESAAAAFRPGSNMRGPARELGHFYEALLGGGRSSTGTRAILNPQTVTALTATHRVGMFDESLGAIVNWGLGFLVNSHPAAKGELPPPYGFGIHASRRAFGHGGSQSSVGFADPEHHLVVALVCNGMPGEPRHQARMREALAALYQDMGLV